jgi:hypothetical protein
MLRDELEKSLRVLLELELELELKLKLKLCLRGVIDDEIEDVRGTADLNNAGLLADRLFSKAARKAGRDLRATTAGAGEGEGEG